MGDGALGPLEVPTMEQQRFIDRALRSHALLVAGPGTGKTRSLGFVASEIVNGGVPEVGVVSVTLTRAMAGSLGKRIRHGSKGTLHSFALGHLNRLGEAWGRRVADPWAVENVVRIDLQLGVEAEFHVRPTLPQIDRFLKALGTAFREGQDEPPNLDVVEQRLWHVFRTQRELFRYRLMDELVTDLVTLLDQGAHLVNPPTHVLVDEYQDLTAGELRLLQLLAARNVRVIAAGDDRQSIYKFREADERALHRFAEVYDTALDPLTESWRCPRRICELAEAIAEPLQPLPGLERPPLIPMQGRAEEGTVRIVTLSSPRTEARWIVRECQRLITGGVRACDIVVVTPAYLDQVLRILKKVADDEAGLTFAFYDPRFLDPASQTPAVRLLGAGVRLLADPDDQIAWRTIVWATPNLAEGRLTRLLTAGRGSYSNNLEYVAREDATCGRPWTAGRAVTEQFGGQDLISGRDLVTLLAEQLGIPALNLDPLGGLEAVLGVEASPADWSKAVIEISQKTLIDPEERPNDIPVRTIHGAKGLEAPVVFLCSAIEQGFIRGGAADAIRRLYVAVTRASRSLYISAPRGLAHTALGHVAESRTGGLAALITTAVARRGLVVERM